MSELQIRRVEWHLDIESTRSAKRVIEQIGVISVEC